MGTFNLYVFEFIVRDDRCGEELKKFSKFYLPKKTILESMGGLDYRIEFPETVRQDKIRGYINKIKKYYC